MRPRKNAAQINIISAFERRTGVIE
jgi:hypothetical protein